MNKRLYRSRANVLSAGPVATFLKNAPERSAFVGRRAVRDKSRTPYGSRANVLSAGPVATFLKNAPERSAFVGAGTVFALSLSLSLSLFLSSSFLTFSNSYFSAFIYRDWSGPGPVSHFYG
jgi:hypothetical protein